MTNNDDAYAWWWTMSAEERERFDELARNSILALDHYPYTSAEAASELLAWINLEIEIATAYADWLANLKRRVQSRGRPWTRAEFLRVCRLTEAGD